MIIDFLLVKSDYGFCDRRKNPQWTSFESV